jgi:DNA-binding response OmpR family regulator
MRLLVIDDFSYINKTLAAGLKRYYAVDIVHSGKEGIYEAMVNSYDLIIVGIVLSDMSGIEACRRIRAEQVKVPLIFLSDRFHHQAVIEALDAGADDFLTHSLDLSTLIALIRARLRRHQHHSSNLLIIDSLELDTARRTVLRAGQPINLRRKEFDLLEYLMRNAGRVLTREMILEHVWDRDVDLFTNAVDVHIKTLRDRIDKPFSTKLIQTVHGLGYKIGAQ